MQISPTPVREALGRLEAVGLAEHIPHGGTRVSRLSAVEFRELYELRLILESLAISKAAERFSPGERDAARGHLERLAAAVRSNALPEVQEAHTAFHFALYDAANSRWLGRLIVPLWDSCRRYRFQPNNLLTNRVQNEQEHEKILQACIAHDPKAAATALYNHTVRNANIFAKATFGEAFFQTQD